MKSCGFHGKDLYLACICIGCIPNEPKIQHSVVDLVLSCISVLVLTGFSVDHGIWWISCMKSGGFHGKDLWMYPK